MVKTMKTIAAVSIRQYEKAVESLTDYNRTIEMGLHVVLKQSGLTFSEASRKQPHRLAAIVFGSDQGMCGQFNEQITNYTLESMKSMGINQEKRMLMVVGERVHSSLEAEGQKINSFFKTPGSVDAITPLVQDILLKIETWRSHTGFDRVIMFHNRPKQGASYKQATVYLLPMDREWLKKVAARTWPSRSLPTFSMNWDKLLSALVSQYLFVSIYRAMAESLESENASRLSSMQNAEKNIEDQIDDLEAKYRHERQRSITEELFDIVSGFEALTK